MRYLKLFEGFNDDWSRVKQNINDMLVELKDNGFYWEVFYKHNDRSRFSLTGEDEIIILVTKKNDSEETTDEQGNISYDEYGWTGSKFELADVYEYIIPVVDYIKDSYGREEKYSHGVAGVDVKYLYVSPTAQYGGRQKRNLLDYDLLLIDKSNIRYSKLKRMYAASKFIVEIKMWK